MKIVRYFIHAENQDTGMIGYLPLWVPRSSNFDPVMGVRGLLHDCLEHRLCDTGKVHEEAMAFGRLLALRVTSWASDGRTNAFSLGTEFAGVLADALQQTDDEFSILPESPGVGRLFDWGGRQEISTLVKQCHRALKSDLDSCEDIQMPQPEFFTRLAHWIMIGFIDAHRRYGGGNGCGQVGSMFDRYSLSSRGHQHTDDRRLGDMIEQSDVDEEHVLRVTIDTESADVKFTQLHKNYEYGRHPEWLHKRIRRWKTA